MYNIYIRQACTFFPLPSVHTVYYIYAIILKGLCALLNARADKTAADYCRAMGRRPAEALFTKGANGHFGETAKTVAPPPPPRAHTRYIFYHADSCSQRVGGLQGSRRV